MLTYMPKYIHKSKSTIYILFSYITNIDFKRILKARQSTIYGLGLSTKLMLASLQSQLVNKSFYFFCFCQSCSWNLKQFVQPEMCCLLYSSFLFHLKQIGYISSCLFLPFLAFTS